MKTFYIPTTSLNFNNILSSESVSPKAFYQERGFGYSRWYSVDENPLSNSTIIFDELRYFSRPLSDYEDHPLLIEVTLDEETVSRLIQIEDHVFVCGFTIYLDPFSSKLLFYSEKDKMIALSLSESSLETKLVKLYSKKIQVVNTPRRKYPTIPHEEIQDLNLAEIDKDKRINRLKGWLYGYYVGAILSASKSSLKKLNAAREIHSVLAAILASFDHKATLQQREKLKTLIKEIQPPVPLYEKLMDILQDNSLLFSVLDVIRKEYGYISGEYSVDTMINRLLMPSSNPDSKNHVLEEVSALEREYEALLLSEHHLVDVDRGEAVITEGMVACINNSSLSNPEKTLYEAWVNEVLIRDEFNGRVSTFKDRLSDEITIKAKEKTTEDWKGSYAEVTLNSLRRHVRGGEFLYTWGDDVFSAIAAVVVRGDDWQQLVRFMQQKEMTDYRIAISMFGALNGFASLPRDFTDTLYSQNRVYLGSVYKEFYGQLFGRNVPTNVVDTVSSPKEQISALINNNTPDKTIEDMPDFTKEEVSSTDTVLVTNDDSFVAFMSELSRKCPGAKKDELKYRELFIENGGLTEGFQKAVFGESSLNKGKGAQKAVLDLLVKLMRPHSASKKKALAQKTAIHQTATLFDGIIESTGCFLTDFDYLANNPQFIEIVSVYKDWEKDLKWFIDAHDPKHKDYQKCYEGKPVDNETIIKQYIWLQKGKYAKTEPLLRRLYLK